MNEKLSIEHVALLEDAWFLVTGGRLVGRRSVTDAMTAFRYASRVGGWVEAIFPSRSGLRWSNAEVREILSQTRAACRM